MRKTALSRRARARSRADVTAFSAEWKAREDAEDEKLRRSMNLSAGAEACLKGRALERCWKAFRQGPLDSPLKPGSCLSSPCLHGSSPSWHSLLRQFRFGVIFGGPIGDPTHWHEFAAEIALGEGIATSIRRFYSLLLALPFQFFGYDVAVAKMMNALLDSA